MKILIYGINYAPELTGIGKYTGEMAPWFAGKGHDVRVITAPPYYPEWQVHAGYSRFGYSTAIEQGVRVTRCPLYVPKRVSPLKRIIHLCTFSLSSLFPVIGNVTWKPDLIVLVVPTLFCALQALALSRITGAQIVLHIQDFEVDAMFGLMKKDRSAGRCCRLVQRIERRILQRFDWISTISGAMLWRAEAKGANKEQVLLFPNWVDLTHFASARRDEQLLQRLGCDPAKKTVLYAGNLGAKQGLELVLEAAAQFADRNDVQFLIAGEGTARDRLQQGARDLELDNVQFAPLQSLQDLPNLLASADCHLVVQRRGAADAVLPSKLTNILAVGGNAVITADSMTHLGRLCADHLGIAVCVEPESVGALVNGINQCLEAPAYNEVAANYADNHLDKQIILQRFLDAFEPARLESAEAEAEREAS